MSKHFLEELRRLAPEEKPERLEVTARELEAMVLRLSALLMGLGDSLAQDNILTYFSATALAAVRNRQVDPNSNKLTPELLEWARSQFSEEEYAAGLREIE